MWSRAPRDRGEHRLVGRRRRPAAARPCCRPSAGCRRWPPRARGGGRRCRSSCRGSSAASRIALLRSADSGPRPLAAAPARRRQRHVRHDGRQRSASDHAGEPACQHQALQPADCCGIHGPRHRAGAVAACSQFRKGHRIDSSVLGFDKALEASRLVRPSASVGESSRRCDRPLATSGYGRGPRSGCVSTVMARPRPISTAAGFAGPSRRRLAEARDSPSLGL